MSALVYPGWVEAMAIVPSGISISASNPNGGPATCPLAPGNYFLTGAAGLVQAVQDSLNASDADGWKVALSTSASDGLNATGLVTLDNSRAGAKLTKTGGVNGTNDTGASSVQTIAGDGFVEVYVGDVSSTRFFGLSTSDPDVNPNSIDYCIRYDVTDYDVYENGNVKLSIAGLSVGDTLRVQRTGTVVTFLRNGVVYYTSATPSTGALMVDVSLAWTSGPLQGVRLYDASIGAFKSITWQNVANATATTDTFSVDWGNAGDLRSILGFNTQPTTGAFPQLATWFCDGLWFPNSPLMLDGDPREFPILSDRRSTEGPTGIVSTLVGSVKYHHENLQWQVVPQNRYREVAAYTTRGSYENWIKATQLGQGGYVWFQPGSAIQIYDHTSQLVGSDAYGGTGPVYGWTIPDINRVRAQRRDKNGWNGVWIVTFPSLVSQG